MRLDRRRLLGTGLAALAAPAARAAALPAEEEDLNGSVFHKKEINPFPD